MTSSMPLQGQMVLYSSVTPPLDDGSYRLTVSTNVQYNTSRTSDTPPAPLSQQHYLDVVGPRFSVPASMVAGCFPPANSHGTFQDDLPHIVLGRRTLPWERELLPPAQIPAIPLGPADAPALTDPYPWVALLLFEEGEYTLLRNIPLQQAVPPDVFTALGSPTGITCDAVQADASLVASIMPTLEEMQLLVHVRQVNTDDKELNAYGGDGFFSVVVANRLPSANAQCRAVLVSLEQRRDLIQATPPRPIASPLAAAATPGAPAPVLLKAKAVETFPGSNAFVAPGTASAAGRFTLSSAPARTFNAGNFPVFTFPPVATVSLVALTSWRFTCEGPGSFRELMHNLDTAMFGTVAQPGQPPLTDTGHIPLTLQDRAGASEDVLYRGPLVQYQLTRDNLGPYHSADQARRVTPESGTEDISYAAAFEVGRLLAAADRRLAQALMRWRRESYKQSARLSTIAAANLRVNLDLPVTLADQLHTPVAPRAATAATVAVTTARPVLGDPYGLGRVAGAPGLNAAALAATWQLPSTAAATALLGGDPGTLGTPATPPALTPRANATLAAVAADAAGLASPSYSAHSRDSETSVVQAFEFTA